MQDTNTTIIISSANSLQEEALANISRPIIKFRNKAGKYDTKNESLSLFQKIWQFFAKVFNAKKIILAEPEKAIIVQAEQSTKPTAASTISTQPAMNTDSRVHNNLYKIAVQQFNNMDISQTTKN